MRKNSATHRSLWSIVCTLLLIGSLLLSGCAAKPDGQGQTQGTETTPTEAPTAAPTAAPTEAPAETPEAAPTDAPEVEAPVEDAEDPSLVIFRQSMVETPRFFAAAYFGEAEQGADPFALMQEAAPQLCADLPFLLQIDPQHVIGTEGQLFCIVPAEGLASLAVNRRPWNPETGSYEEPEVLYRSESDAPILLLCPNVDWIPDTELVFTEADGTVTVWSPHLDPDYRLTALRDESGENRVQDFTPYEELSLPGLSQVPDSAGLVGVWEQVWTEVEGDLNASDPGICTVEITADEAGILRFSYEHSLYSEDNVRDRELTVVPGELYPGCGNGEWLGEVAEAAGDMVHYALTLEADGTLLLQVWWEMDGMPMVGYSGYTKIS